MNIKIYCLLKSIHNLLLKSIHNLLLLQKLKNILSCNLLIVRKYIDIINYVCFSISHNHVRNLM